jgi:sugar lactone lactonase YvrE
MSLRNAEVDVVLEAQAEVGESPTWDVAREALIWVDIYRHLVHVLDPSNGSNRTYNVGEPVGAVAPSERGSLVVALSGGFAILDPDAGSLLRVASIHERAPDALMNDGKCDPQGRFLAGSTTRSEAPGAGTLYRLDADYGVEVLLRNVTLSNGLGWSPDGKVMYYVDSALQRIDKFVYTDSGHISRRQAFVEIPASSGMPDGLTVDEHGYVWVAMWGGSALRRYSPEGGLEGELRLPVSQVTSCAFGGPDWNELYVTTASWGMGSEHRRREPHAGAVFVARPGMAGLPTRHFHRTAT